MTIHNLNFVFACSCEVLPTGDFWLCDVCQTQLDPKDQLSTDESTRLRRFDDLLDVMYDSEQDALNAGVSEADIQQARINEMEYQAELNTQLEYSNRQDISYEMSLW